LHDHRVGQRHKRAHASAEIRTVELVNADRRAGLFPAQDPHTDRSREILVLAYWECNKPYPAKPEKVLSLGGTGIDDHDPLMDDKFFPPAEPTPDDLDLARTAVSGLSSRGPTCVSAVKRSTPTLTSRSRRATQPHVE
jgi:hypothetical protein